jgi:hypothetical protein
VHHEHQLWIIRAVCIKLGWSVNLSIVFRKGIHKERLETEEFVDSQEHFEVGESEITSLLAIRKHYDSERKIELVGVLKQLSEDLRGLKRSNKHCFLVVLWS